MKSIKITFFFILASFFFLPFSAGAVTLYLDPAVTKLGPNDSSEVKVKIGVSDGECINAAKIVLNFPSDVLEIKDFNSGDSIFSLWIERPNQESIKKSNESGLVLFSGGLPGGYCGKISGDPGDSNIIGSVVMMAKKPIVFSKAGINFSMDTEVFLNDGSGTVAKIMTQGMNFDIDSKDSSSPRDDWSRKITEDKIPPEPFVVEFGKDEKVGGGKYFIVFSTTDKQTGIDHYEVWESRDSEIVTDDSVLGFINSLFRKKEEKISFKIASSPYILKDQELKSFIKVKAVDRAGNERVVEYHNEKDSPVNNKDNNWMTSSVVVVIACVVLLSLLVIIKKIIARK